jgi:hypothetical protein
MLFNIVKPNMLFMKTKKSILGLIFAATVAIFLAPSCAKDDAGSISSKDLAMAQDEAYVDALYQEVDNTVISNTTSLDAGHYSGMGLKSTSDDGECVTITVNHPDSTSFPKIITLDYGTGCTTVFRDDTITRKGQIIITLTDRWFVQGSQHIVTFSNFYINNVKIEGTRTITNMGLNAKNHFELGIVLQNGKITFNDTAWMTRDANHVREWIRSNNPQNDTVLITGTASGINIKGENYERLITTPLVLAHCSNVPWRWVILAGTVQITNSVSGVTTIDYSSSGCDGEVLISRNGYHRNFAFKYKHHNHGNGH